MKLKFIRATFVAGEPVKAGTVKDFDEPTTRILKACGHVEEFKDAPESTKKEK